MKLDRMSREHNSFPIAERSPNLSATVISIYVRSDYDDNYRSRSFCFVERQKRKVNSTKRPPRWPVEFTQQIIIPFYWSVQKSYYMEQWMEVIAEKDRVNDGGTTRMNGQASRCRPCCASRTTEIEGRPSQRMRLSEYPNDTTAPRRHGI